MIAVCVYPVKMPNKNYISGRNFEYRVMAKLRNNGYYVMRAYGSKGMYDLVAIAPLKFGLNTLAVQCKYSVKHKLVMTREEKNKLKNSVKLYNATVVIAYNGVDGINWIDLYGRTVTIHHEPTRN